MIVFVHEYFKWCICFNVPHFCVSVFLVNVQSDFETYLLVDSGGKGKFMHLRADFKKELLNAYVIEAFG